MKKIAGWWMPDEEQALATLLQKIQKHPDQRIGYQCNKFLAAINYCPKQRVVLDVGAHIGLASWFFAKYFPKIIAFEPLATHRECFIKNCDSPSIKLEPFALGEQAKQGFIDTDPSQSGNSALAEDGIACDIKTFDSLSYASTLDVDLVKLDCEGFEYFALRGMEQLLKRCKPCVIVEQKFGHGKRYGISDTEAVTYLENLGARLQDELMGDFILTF